jgi:uncharacterized protein
LVCERHVGVGLSAEEIRCNRLPLPVRDMLPVSIEERLVCYADKFFSKNENERPPEEKPIDRIVDSLRPHGADKVARFLEWAALFD